MYVPFDQILNRSSVFQEILSSLKAEKGLCSVTGLIDSQKVHFSACLLHRMNLKGLYVTYNEFEAKKAYEDFSFFFKDRVLHLPYREVMLAIENRNNMDNRTIGELFYLCYDELQDIKFDEVIQLILEILSECLMEYFMIDDKRVNGFLRIFISRLPEYLKLRLPKSKVA
jgi:hypothetical protein